MTFGDYLIHAVKMLVWILLGSLIVILGFGILWYGMFHSFILILFGTAVMTIGSLAVLYGTKIHNVEPY